MKFKVGDIIHSNKIEGYYGKILTIIGYQYLIEFRNRRATRFYSQEIDPYYHTIQDKHQKHHPLTKIFR